MKTYRYLLVAALLLQLVLVHPSFAQEGQPTPTDASVDAEEGILEEEKEAIKQKIEDLKDRLATRVAQLQAQNRRAFFGIIKTKSDTALTLTHREAEMPVALDTETKVFTKGPNGKKTQSNLDALKAGQSASVFGTLDIDQKTLVASIIIIDELVTSTHGSVIAVDSNANTLTVKAESSTLILDYEITTRCQQYIQEDNELVTCGLSKIEIGDTVFLRIEADDEELTKAKALRILVIPAPAPTETPDTSPTVVEPTE